MLDLMLTLGQASAWTFQTSTSAEKVQVGMLVMG